MDDWKNLVWGFFRTQPNTQLPPPTQIVPRILRSNEDEFFNSGQLSDPSNFGSFFGSSSSMMGNVFAEMERLVKDMDEAFRDFQPMMPEISREGFDNPHFMIPPPMDNFPSIEEGTPKQNNLDANLRDQILKKGYEESSSNKKIDADLDDLYKQSSLDLSKAPVPYDDSRNSPCREPTVRSSFESVTSQYSFSNGKWQGKTIKRTNEGEEITTITQNEKGEVEENKEFRPRGSDENLPIRGNDFGQSAYSDPFTFLDRFFRPRI